MWDIFGVKLEDQMAALYIQVIKVCIDKKIKTLQAKCFFYAPFCKKSRAIYLPYWFSGSSRIWFLLRFPGPSDDWKRPPFSLGYRPTNLCRLKSRKDNPGGSWGAWSFNQPQYFSTSKIVCRIRAALLVVFPPSVSPGNRIEERLPSQRGIWLVFGISRKPPCRRLLRRTHRPSRWKVVAKTAGWRHCLRSNAGHLSSWGTFACSPLRLMWWP